MFRKEKGQPNNETQEARAIKTYRDYAVSSLRDGSTSLAQMIIKEKKKQEAKEVQDAVQRKNTFTIVLSVFLVLLGVAAIVGIFFFSVKDGGNNRDNSLNYSTFIPYQYQKEVDLTGADHRDLEKVFQELVEDTQIPIGDVKVVYFTNLDENGLRQVAPARDFIIALDTRIPVTLERTLYRSFAAGVVTIDSNLPFLIFKVHSFDTAYVRMREWERSVLFDIGPLLDIDKRFYSQKFIDLTLHNEDARVILDEEGRLVFGYAFLQTNTLIFFTSGDTLKHFQTDLQSYQERI